MLAAVCGINGRSTRNKRAGNTAGTLPEFRRRIFPCGPATCCGSGSLRFRPERASKNLDLEAGPGTIDRAVVRGVAIDVDCCRRWDQIGTNANATSRCTFSLLRGEDKATTKYPRSFIRCEDTPADLCDASKVRDFVEVIDRVRLLALIVDHFPGFSRRANVSDKQTLQAMLGKRECLLR